MAAKKAKGTILVSGATGKQGGASLRHLREKGFTVRALTRNSEEPKARALSGHGVELVRGDLDDRASLTRALDGADGVYSVQNAHSAGPEGEVRQGINLAETARQAGVGHFVYSSVASADQRTGIPHFDSKFKIEETVRATGMPFTIVRPVFFMENWLGMRQSIDNGALALPFDPSTRLQMVAVDDIGGVVAQTFQSPGKWRGRVFELAGDELSMTDLASVFSRASGREVHYEQVPWDEFEPKVGPDLAKMYHWLQDTGYKVDIGGARQEYHNLTSFERWINSNWHSAARTA